VVAWGKAVRADDVGPEVSTTTREQTDGGRFRRGWRRVVFVVAIVVAAGMVLAIGLVLTGIIAEPETVLLDIGRLLLRK